MKITITDNTTTITIENADANSTTTRKLLDHLLDAAPTSNPTNARAVVGKDPIPVDPARFVKWLNSRSPLDTIRALDNELFEGAGKMLSASNAHMFVQKYPEAASSLGLERLAEFFVWMSNQGYYAQAPSKRSAQTYYNLASRLASGSLI
jgi:hypothetical protein